MCRLLAPHAENLVAGEPRQRMLELGHRDATGRVHARDADALHRVAVVLLVVEKDHVAQRNPAVARNVAQVIRLRPFVDLTQRHHLLQRC